MSLLPRTRATPSFPAPQLPPLGPLLGFPGSSALFPRTPAVLGVYPRVTRSLDQVVAGHPGSSPSPGPRPLPSPQGTYRSHTGRRSAPKQRDVPRDLPARTAWVCPQPMLPTRTPPPRTGPFSHQPSRSELAAAAAAAAALAPARPGPQSRPPSSGLRLRSSALEFPPRDGPQTSGPRYRHSPAAAPNQLQRHCLYLGRQ